MWTPTGSLTTVSKVMQYLKDTESVDGDPNYEVVERLVSFVSDWAQRYTQGPIINTTITESIDGNGERDVMLNFFPVQSITSITVDGVNETPNIDFYEDGSIFFKDERIFTNGRKNISATYVAGYGTTVPADIEQAVIQLCGHIYRTDYERYSQQMLTPENLEWLHTAPYGAVKLLDYYKRWRITFG